LCKGGNTINNVHKKNHTSKVGGFQAQAMSLGDTFKRFFGESEQSKREREEDEVIKSL
jgi:hypothetical protein